MRYLFNVDNIEKTVLKKGLKTYKILIYKGFDDKVFKVTIYTDGVKLVTKTFFPFITRELADKEIEELITTRV